MRTLRNTLRALRLKKMKATINNFKIDLDYTKKSLEDKTIDYSTLNERYLSAQSTIKDRDASISSLSENFKVLAQDITKRSTVVSSWEDCIKEKEKLIEQPQTKNKE